MALANVQMHLESAFHKFFREPSAGFPRFKSKKSSRKSYTTNVVNGNIFLENRYTDWQNYYPYWTLRNLWMLSKYVPAEKLQIEFLNKWRNTDKYKGEVFAPENYSFEYLFATTLAGQPLAGWKVPIYPRKHLHYGNIQKPTRNFSMTCIPTLSYP